jgi:hypothetical protein
MLLREPRDGRDPIEWPNIASVLAVDDETVAFWRLEPRDRITSFNLSPVDICGNVDKMFDAHRV